MATPPKPTKRRPKKRRWFAWLTDNIGLKLFALLFSTGLWVFVNFGERDFEKTLEIPLELRNLPPAFVVTSPIESSVDVRLRGSRTILSRIEGQSLAITLDLARVRPDRTTSFPFDPKDLSLPRGVRVQRISPREINIEVERRIERTIGVEPQLEAAPEGLKVGPPTVRPNRIRVEGPRSYVARIEGLKTPPVEIPSEPGDHEIQIDVKVPTDLLTLTPPQVVVLLRVSEILESRTVDGVSVRLINVEGTATPEAALAQVTVSGPQRRMGTVDPEAIRLIADATGLQPGKHSVQIRAEMPAGFQADSIVPAVMNLQIVAPVVEPTPVPTSPPVVEEEKS